MLLEFSLKLPDHHGSPLDPSRIAQNISDSCWTGMVMVPLMGMHLQSYNILLNSLGAVV